MEAIAQIIERIHATSQAATPTGPSKTHDKLDSFPWHYVCYTPIHKKMLGSAVGFLNSVLVGDDPKWLTFLGPSGCGKTYLMRQLVKNLLAASCNRWWRAWVVDGRAKAGWGIPTIEHVQPQRDLDSYRAAREYADCDLVYVEDMGAGSSPDKGASKVVRDRLSELMLLRTGKWTLADANLMPNEIEEIFDGRLVSRLRRDDSECIIIPKDTPDFCTLKRK